MAGAYLRGTLSALAALGLTACAVGTDYERPVLDLPETWRVAPGEAAALANAAWWSQFGDPVLDELVTAALAENLDVRIAAARVAQFSGALQAAQSRFLPQLGIGAGAARGRSSEFTIAPGADPYSTQYRAVLGATWQLDLFGRLRRESEAAQARVYASEQAQRGVLLSVAAGVAASYISLLALDSQLEIARATAANFENTLAVFRLRHREGVVSRLEVAQVESQYQQAIAVIPLLEAQVAEQENLLSILLGRPPGPIARGRTLDTMALPLVPVGLPSSILEQRPDILQAEQNLVAANADAGAARALYYPDISLTGALGQLSLAAGDLLDSAARTWTAAADISAPIFTAGGISGRVASAEAAREQAILQYQATILGALRDVNDALAAATASSTNSAVLAARAATLGEYAALARMRFAAGASSYLEVLYAENELFAAELAMVAARQAELSNRVVLYRATGGGWSLPAGPRQP